MSQSVFGMLSQNVLTLYLDYFSKNMCASLNPKQLRIT